MSVITRFAPSPTGHLHIGGARTALFCWAYARGQGGRFVLRIEDTDQKRSSVEAVGGILDDLAWLGIGWDDGPEAGGLGGDPRGVGPFFQSERLGLYQTYFDQLLDAGLAYPAFESGEELAAMRAEARGEKRTFRYVRAADYDHAVALERMKTEEYVLRLRVEQHGIVVRDAVLGAIAFDASHYDDFVIRKPDGYPTYHFAVVVDDELMGVTHVLRGQEHLNNSPKHVALQQTLKRHDTGEPFRTPVYAHMPLIFNADGSKMSKRDKDKAVRQETKRRRDEETEWRDALAGVSAEEFGAWLGDKTRQLPTEALVALAGELGVELPEIDVEDFRRAGYLPEVVCNYLALLGWSKGDDVERFGMDEFVSRFELESIGKSNAKFDREKLLAFNFDTIQTMEPAALAEQWRKWCARYDREVVERLGDRMRLAAGAVRQRAKTLRQMREPLAFLFVDEVEFDAKAVKKVLHKNEGAGLKVLGEMRDVLKGIDPWEPGCIEGVLTRIGEARGLGMGQIAQPVRVALTGTSVSPGLGDTLALVGRDGSLRRIDRCLRECQP